MVGARRHVVVGDSDCRGERAEPVVGMGHIWHGRRERNGPIAKVPFVADDRMSRMPVPGAAGIEDDFLLAGRRRRIRRGSGKRPVVVNRQRRDGRVFITFVVLHRETDYIGGQVGIRIGGAFEMGRERAVQVKVVGDPIGMLGDAVEAPACPCRERVLIVRIERGPSVKLHDAANFTGIRPAWHCNRRIRNRVDSHLDIKQGNSRGTAQLPGNVVNPVEVRIGAVPNQAVAFVDGDAVGRIVDAADKQRRVRDCDGRRRILVDRLIQIET